MSKKIVIIPESVCSDKILVEVNGDAIESVEFEGGCEGNGRALGRLLKGMPVEKAIQLLSGVDCEGKGTSCADQLAKGLAEQATGTTIRLKN